MREILQNDAMSENRANPELVKRDEVKNIMEYETVELDEQEKAVVIIDQTKLPGRTEIIRLKSAQEIWNAIYLLQVRGAPAIGVAAAFGIYVLADAMETEDYDAFLKEFQKQKEYLDSARPTAVNLSWALKRMEGVVLKNADRSVAQIKELLKRELLPSRRRISVCAGRLASMGSVW